LIKHLLPELRGANQGNGSASEYFNTSPDTNNVPVESQLNDEEQKIKKEATKKDKKDNSQKDNYYVEPPKEKKKGFFRRIFGPKKD
jgi:penicillin-binding protein 1A